MTTKKRLALEKLAKLPVAKAKELVQKTNTPTLARLLREYCKQSDHHKTAIVEVFCEAYFNVFKDCSPLIACVKAPDNEPLSAEDEAALKDLTKAVDNAVQHQVTLDIVNQASITLKKV